MGEFASWEGTSPKTFSICHFSFLIFHWQLKPPSRKAARTSERLNRIQNYQTIEKGDKSLTPYYFLANSAALGDLAV